MSKIPDIIIVDDHKTFRQGLSAIITSAGLANVVGEAADGKELIDLLANCHPDLVLMDIDVPRINGTEATRRALDLIPELKIIALTMFGDPDYYNKMLELGARGFMLKTSGIRELEDAIAEVMNGGYYYSSQLQIRDSIKNSRKINNNLPENSGRILPS